MFNAMEKVKKNTFGTASHEGKEYVIKLLHLFSILCLIGFELQTLQ